jgi:hypothetical protein
MDTINDERRRFNSMRFERKCKEDLERRLPWGANQGRLRNYAINVIEKLEKLYKN